MSFRDWFRPGKALELTADQATVVTQLDAVRDAGPRFDVSIDPVMLYGYDPAAIGSPAQPLPAARIDRRTALQVPAVKRARDLVCGTLGTLPLELFGPDHAAVRWALFDQPEPDVPRSVTLTRTFEDMFFEGLAWWKITKFGWHGYPTEVRRLDPSTVNVRENAEVWVTRQGNTGVTWEYVPDAELIRFDSPNAPLLVAGARAIRTCLNLEAAAASYAADPLPLAWFTPAEGADPAEDDDVTAILDAWAAARRKRATGYVPAALKLNTAATVTAEQMQLAESRQHAVLEIARVAGIDPEELGVAVTSRTYFNAFDRKQNFVQRTLGGYRQAFEDRLSMGDVTARGYVGRFNLDAYLRTDATTRYQAYAAGLAVGAITPEQIRAAEGVPESAATDELPDAPPREDTTQPPAAAPAAIPPGGAQA